MGDLKAIVTILLSVKKDNRASLKLAVYKI